MEIIYCFNKVKSNAWQLSGITLLEYSFFKVNTIKAN
jgi:hypothetical protein